MWRNLLKSISKKPISISGFAGRLKCLMCLLMESYPFFAPNLTLNFLEHFWRQIQSCSDLLVFPVYCKII